MADKTLTTLTQSPDGMERRSVVTDVVVERRDDIPDAPRVIAGYGIVYNQREHFGPFSESVAPSVARVLDDSPSVLCMFNHSPDKLLARTDNGSLRLRSDDHGLHFTATMPDGVSWADDVYAAVRANLVTGASFWFQITEEDWDYSGEIPHRTIKGISLIEVGPVCQPAYSGTVVSARALQRAADAPVAEVPPVEPVTEPDVDAFDAETEAVLALLAIELAQVE